MTLFGYSQADVDILINRIVRHEDVIIRQRRVIEAYQDAITDMQESLDILRQKLAELNR